MLQVRQLSEKVQEQPEYQSDKDKKAEFSIPSWMVSIITLYQLLRQIVNLLKLLGKKLNLKKELFILKKYTLTITFFW